MHDLLSAFRAPLPPKSARAPVARNVPVVKKKARSWTLLAVAAAFLCGAGAVIAMALLGIQPIDARYVDLARESRFMQFVQSTLGDPEDQTGIQEAVTSADAESISSTLPVDSAAPPSAQESDTDTNEPGLSTQQPDLRANEPDASLPALATANTDGGETNDLQAVPVEDNDLAIDASSPEVESTAAVTGMPGFQLGSAVYSIQESGQALAVEIHRQGNLSIPASVELTTYAGSAESAVDFADLERHEVFFAAGETSKTIFVPIVADATPEGSEIFRIALGNTLGEIMRTDGAIATVIIIDDDS